jgi:hypothetical protein
MQFRFFGMPTGYLAFTPPATMATALSDSRARALLLVTDAGADAVHLVDVVGRSHAGYLAPPGSIEGPRGVAASGASPLVAVSTWMAPYSDHVVVVYRGSGVVWEVVRAIGGGFGGPGHHDGQLQWPMGLRFCGDGSRICVVEYGNSRVSVFRVDDGGFVGHMATGKRLNGPFDVEEVEGGWLVACRNSHRVEFVGEVEFVGDADGGDGDRWPSLGKCGRRDGEFWYPAALAVMPGLGLVVREDDGRRLQVFATPDILAMATMSCMRAAWLVAVGRAVLRRISY